MRHVLVLSTMFLVTGIEPEAGSWFGNNAVSQISALPDAKSVDPAQAFTITETGAAALDDSIAAQVASLRKTDRLFVMGREQAYEAPAATSAALEPTLTEPSDIEGPPAELTTGEFCEALAQAAEASDIPVAFFARLIWHESKFKHDAMSHVGAQGVAQFMPRTAAEMGLDDPFDPRKALPASARFLRRLHDQFGNLGLAAAAYNAGSGRIQNWLARRGPLPEETRTYVRRITGNSAETWTSEKKTAALQQELPREAPCEGIGGLSRKKEVVTMAVELTPGASETIRKAEAARIAAAAAKAKSRLLLAKASKRTGATQVASGEKSAKKTMVIAVAKKVTTIKTAALGRLKTKDAKERRIKVASATK